MRFKPKMLTLMNLVILSDIVNKKGERAVKSNIKAENWNHKGPKTVPWGTPFTIAMLLLHFK